MLKYKVCERCHIDAPNIEDENFMWDWIIANKTPFYDTFFKKRALKEYEFIYNKKFSDELIERDILSSRDLEIFFNLPIGRYTNHFAHPWKNDSTNAGLLRMRLEIYDKKYKDKLPRTELFREKEKKFDSIVRIICNIAKEYNWDVWEGRTKNPFAITINTFINRDRRKGISIKLCRNNEYKACFTDEVNPNNNRVSEYIIELGEDEKEVEEFVREEVEKFYINNGKNENQKYVFTINPIYHLREEI